MSEYKYYAADLAMSGNVIYVKLSAHRSELFLHDNPKLIGEMPPDMADKIKILQAIPLPKKYGDDIAGAIPGIGYRSFTEGAFYIYDTRSKS